MGHVYGAEAQERRMKKIHLFWSQIYTAVHSACHDNYRVLKKKTNPSGSNDPQP